MRLALYCNRNQITIELPKPDPLPTSMSCIRLQLSTLCRWQRQYRGSIAAKSLHRNTRELADARLSSATTSLKDGGRYHLLPYQLP